MDQFNHNSQASLLPPCDLYLPPSQRKSLMFSSVQEADWVQAAEGCGKATWVSALTSPEHREYLREAYPELGLPEKLTIKQVIGNPAGGALVSGETLCALARHGDPSFIWRVVVLSAIDALPKHFDVNHRRMSLHDWLGLAQWAKDNPEDCSLGFEHAAQRLEGEGALVRLLCHGIERDLLSERDLLGAREVSAVSLVKGLMMLSRDLRYMDAIRLKVYVDLKTLEDWRVTSFVDASKMLYSRAYLAWRREDLCALYFHRLANTPHQIGQAFRDMAQGLGFVLRDLPSGARLLPRDLQIDAAQQALLFNRFFPLVADVGKSKSFNAYRHLFGQMEKTSKHLSPRGFTEALSYVVGSGAAWRKTWRKEPE